MNRAADLIARCHVGIRRLAGVVAAGAAMASLAVPTAQAQHVSSHIASTQIGSAQIGAAQIDQVAQVQNTFDSVFGTEMRGPRTYSTPFELQLAAVAEASRGRIGVAAIDLASGRTIQVLGDQRFPMASTSKVAIAATFLEGVDQGRWSLTSEFPLLVPVASAPFSSAVAPVRAGEYMTAQRLIELMITRSNNYATDALLKVVGGPAAVNAWVRRAGIQDWQIDRDIATLVRDDGAIDPAQVIDTRDSATPLAMVRLLAGIYEGKWLSPASREVLLGTMGRCITGKQRIRAGMPEGVQVLHKTGSLNNTSSDIGIIETPEGRTFAVAIYVTGQGGRPGREARIASIARTIYDGYLTERPNYRRTASR